MADLDLDLETLLADEKPEKESKRRTVKAKSTKQEALADLAKARERSSKRSEQFEVKSVDSVYDQVDESDYAARVEKNRAGGSFVVDDEGMGYDDLGEEEVFGDDYNDLDEDVGKRARKAGSKKRKTGALNATNNSRAKAIAKAKAAAVPSQKIQAALLNKPAAGGSEAFAKKFGPKEIVSGDDDFEALLNDVGKVDGADSLTIAQVKTEDVLAHTPYSKAAAKSEPKPAAKPPKKKAKLDASDAPMDVDTPTPAPGASATTTTTTTPASSAAAVAQPLTAAEKERQLQEALLAAEGLPDFTGAEVDAVLTNIAKSKPKPAKATGAKKAGQKGAADAGENSDEEDDKMDEDHVFTGDDWWKISEQVMADLEARQAGDGVALTPSGSDVPANLPIQEGKMRIWWFDAHEDAFNKPGVVYLFGKMHDPVSKQWKSVCVFVQNLDRVLHIAPKKGADMAAVREELETLRKLHKISTLKSKVVKKNYAFEVEGVPHGESEFLEVRYPYTEPALPNDLKASTFTHIFGATRSGLENFIISHKFMGPSWITISNPVVHNVRRTWCHFECSVNSPNDVAVTQFKANEKVPAAPTLTLMSLKVQTILNHEKHQNEVLAVAVMIKTKVDLDGETPKAAQNLEHEVLIRRLSEQFPKDFEKQTKSNKKVKVVAEQSEKALLAGLLAKIQKYDPDVLIGHAMVGFDLDILLHRCQANNVPHWSRLGHLKLDKMPRLQKGSGGEGDSFFIQQAVRQVTAGRLLCDTYLTSRELLRSQKNYKLSTLARSQLNSQKVDIDEDSIPQYLATGPQLFKLCEIVLNDAFLALSLAIKINVLPLTKQLTELGGNIWNRSLTGARAERIEYLLLHKFNALNYVCPDKSKKEGGGGKRKGKPAYEGGLVLEPKKGLYDKFVLLLDFNSLYPSIIQEYNVCFTTIERKKNEQGNWIPAEPPVNLKDKGILPITIRELVERRRNVKALWKKATDPVEKQQYDVKQLAIKLVANSMYGCLGFKNSRFYAMPMAELITRKGRETLQKTVDIARNQLNLDVIYGDTDSVMINSNSLDLAAAKKMGNEMKKVVNKLYSNLEIDIDGIYKPLLLLKKKKYAALTVTEKENGTIEYARSEKGLDLVRRDWCDLSVDMGRYVLDQILSGKPREEVVEEIHTYLSNQATAIRNGEIPINKFGISKTMTKKPEEYPDPHSQPHVMVALTLRAQGRIIQVGEQISYVICKTDDTSKQLMAEKAHYTENVKKDGKVPDYEWYLANQIHPPIARLCEPIEGTDSPTLAHCLGLDPNKFAVPQETAAGEVDVSFAPSVLQDERTRYKDVEKFTVTCMHCHQTAEFKGIWNYDAPKDVGDSLACGVCKKQFNVAQLLNAVVLYERKQLQRYHNATYKCEDTGCGATTRHLVFVKKDFPRCMECANQMYLEFDSHKLYLHLKYLQSLFDADAFVKKIVDGGEKVDIRALQSAVSASKWRGPFSVLRDRVDQLLRLSTHRIIPLQDINGPSRNAVLVAK